MKSRSLFARGLALALLAFASLGLTACHVLYKYTQFNFAGRVTPPSGLQQRVLASYSTVSGSSGGLEILDGLRDLRMNIQDTIPSFHISGYSGGNPVEIFNFPEEQFGYVLSTSDGSLANVNYATEASSGNAATFGANTPSAGAAETGTTFAGVSATGGLLYVVYGGATYGLNLPNVNKVAVNQAGSIILAMTRNTNSLYRVVQLPISSNPVTPPGAVDCQPLLIPLFCVVPVAGNYDRPINASFSLDGTSVYILNAGPESGGTQSSVSILNSSALLYNTIPSVNPLSSGAPSPLQALPVPNPIPIPGGATAALSDGTNLYVSGQSTTDYTGGSLTNASSSGLFTGYLTTVNLTTYAASAPVSISDGTHTKMLFADNNTLWVGSQGCASGKRHAVGQNYNCLTMVTLGGSGPLPATIIPAVTPGGTATVPYPNENGDLYYYGDLTGLCWVQNYNKVYTAYGGQVHAFQTANGSEINNYNITVQGTVLDVAYMDALTNAAN